MIKTETRTQTNTAKRRRWLVAGSLLTLVVLAAAAGVIWFFAGDAPAEVDLAATASSVSTENSGPAGDSSIDIEGTWNVDTSVGTFTLEDTTTASFVGFRVEEVLNSIGSATAVGRTPEVSGAIVIERTSLESAEIAADLTSIVTDESRRDDSIQRSLGTSSNPDATFVLSEPIELGDAAAEGEVVSVTATGTLTINGVAKGVEIALQAQLIDDMILVTGSTEIDFADYAITTPTAPVVLSVEDHGVIEVQLWLTR